MRFYKPKHREREIDWDIIASKQQLPLLLNNENTHKSFSVDMILTIKLK